MTDENYAQPDAELTAGRMPLLGFGTWQIDESDAEAAVANALAAGYRHIDTATGYGNEAGVGRGIRSSGLARDEVFVTTKLPPDHAGRERQTIEESLEKLGLDFVDLWLVHWPPNGEASPDVWREVIAAKNDGLAKDIGVSNYSVDQIDELIDATGTAPSVNQIKWSPALYDGSLVTALRERNVVLEGYSPFKASNLADPTLTAIAEAHDADSAQVIVAWHLAHGFVVIPKSTKPERIISNAAGADVVLTDDEVTSIDGLAGS